MNTRDLSLRIRRIGKRTWLVILVLVLSPYVATAAVKQNRVTVPVAGSAVSPTAQPAIHSGSLPSARPAPMPTMVPGLPSLVNVPPLVFRGVELPGTMVTPMLRYVGVPIPDHVNTPGLRFRGQRTSAPMPRL